VGRWWVRRLDEIPRIGPEEANDPEWYPLQHHFGLTAFGVNVYVARAAGDNLLEEHDETHSGHEELYYVTTGRARFTLDGEGQEVDSGSVVAVPDPAVRRVAVAVEAGTTVVAIGAPPRPEFESSWNPRHFEGVPRAE
jgi:mannose-6-phosphate isomerase-like protein (cupin superfamily)